jgi:hypothetical protein
VPGGLGLDREFFESILVPQVMLYGFLGFKSTADGFCLNPHLPKDWPELSITRVHWQDLVLTVTAKASGTVVIAPVGPSHGSLQLVLPSGAWHTRWPEARIQGNRVFLPDGFGTVELQPDKN